MRVLFFFFNDTATTEIYTLSLHDALPICRHWDRRTPRSHLPGPSAKRRILGRALGRRGGGSGASRSVRSEEHTSELQPPDHLVCRLLLEKKNPLSPAPPDATAPLERLLQP